jgi:hypothetical protein
MRTSLPVFFDLPQGIPGRDGTKAEYLNIREENHHQVKTDISAGLKTHLAR